MSFQFASLIDQGLPVTTFTNPVVGIRTDGSDVDVTVTVHSASIPQMDRRRLKEAAIWVRLLAVPQVGRIQPVFVFRIGGWYFSAPMELGDASLKKQDALRRAIAAVKAPAAAGSWTIIFRLVDAATMTTAALRSVALTKNVLEEAAALFLKSLDNQRRTQAHKAVPQKEAFLSDHDLVDAMRAAARVA